MLEYLKSANKKINEHTGETIAMVSKMLKEIELGGEVIVEDYSKKFDKYTGLLNVSEEQIAKAESSLSSEFKDDIRYAKENVERFALAQRNSLNEFDVEIRPGLIAGQKTIPLSAAGCYVPGGRYSHIASAIMTVTTAKVAGVKHISVCSPPRDGQQMPNEIIYAANFCGADSIFSIGGVQGIAGDAAFGTVHSAFGKHAWCEWCFCVREQQLRCRRGRSRGTGLADRCCPASSPHCALACAAAATWSAG